MTDAASVLIAVSRAGAPTGIITGVAGAAGVLIALSVSTCLLTITRVLTCTSLVGVGSIHTLWLRDSHQTPAVAKPHIEVKVIVIAHGVFLLK